MSTTHNPTNFEPADYEVLDYLDNQPPQFIDWSGGLDPHAIESFKAELNWWRESMRLTFGDNWKSRVHHCHHCGNGMVRWITAVRHVPTGEVVVFGAECTARLAFKNGKEFRLAMLKKKAEAHKESLKAFLAREAFLASHPDVAAAKQDVASNPACARNTFAQDILRKLDKYGSISDKQASCLVESVKRDIDRATQAANEPPAGPAPTGRVDIEGEVVSVKLHENEFGSTLKMLLKLANGSKVWTTVPRAAADVVERGDTMKITVTCTVSDKDASFAFGKRPTLLAHTAKVK